MGRAKPRNGTVGAKGRGMRDSSYGDFYDDRD